MEMAPVILIGKFVRLEPLSIDHIDDLVAVGLDDRIWQYMRYGKISSKADIAAWVQGRLLHQQDGNEQVFAVIYLESGKAIGATRYMDIHREDRNLEIGGTWYGVDYQRTVVNTECKYLMLKHAFEVYDCIRVFLKTDSRNIRSQHAIERIGGVKEGFIRDHMILPDGTVRSSIFYSILIAEWPGVKARLEALL